jgi:hypothetical protein
VAASAAAMREAAPSGGDGAELPSADELWRDRWAGHSAGQIVRTIGKRGWWELLREGARHSMYANRAVRKARPSRTGVDNWRRECRTVIKIDRASLIGT